jgi:hypothetical protein
MLKKTVKLQFLVQKIEFSGIKTVAGGASRTTGGEV